MTAPGLYGALLRLLPSSVTAEDRSEMLGMFESLWRDAESWGRRARVLVSSLAGLWGLIVLEWWDHLGSSRIRSRRKGEGMVGLWSGARHGVRSLARTPSFTASVVVLLALGIGAVTAIFSVVDHVVLRPLPYPAAERLVKIEEGSHSGPTFHRLATMETVEEWAGVMAWNATLTGGEEPLRIVLARVSRDFFPMFDARPAAGRLLVDGDWETADGVVLSHGLWQRVYGGDPAVVGRTIRIDGEPRVVLGVVDASFVSPEGLDADGTDVYTPIDWTGPWFTDDDYHVLSVAGRLAPGVPLDRAQAEADALAVWRAEESEHFVEEDGTPQPLPVVPLRDATVQSVRAGLGLIFGAVTLLLLVACVNVAHLFMARGVERKREMAVRRALGAGNRALARQLAIESGLVGLTGAVIGAGLAYGGIAAFQATAAGALPRMDTIAVDPRVLGFAVTVGLATALAFGLFPALRLATDRRESPLRQAGRGSTPGRRTHAVRNGLVVAEVALSLVLMAQAGWLIRAFTELHTTDLGFRTENVWTLPLAPTEIETGEEWYRRMQGVRESLAAVPGVRSTAFGLTMPLQYVGGSSCCWQTTPIFEGDDPEADDLRRARIHPVTADYFDLLGLPLVAGRGWSRAEESALAEAAHAGRADEARDGDPVEGGAAAGGEAGGPVAPVVLSEPLAVAEFGAADAALGRGVSFGDRSHTVIGVAADNHHYGPDRPHGNAIYMPASAIPFEPGRATMAVLTTGPQEGLPRVLAKAVWAAEPDLPVPTVRSMEDWASRATARTRFVSGLFTAFGAIALLLVAGGLAGTLLYTVRVRRQELGIRLALGATPFGLEGSVLRRGAALAGVGIVVGGVAAWASGRLLEGLVVGVEARHAGTFGIAVAVLLTVALVASWVPARRAARTDPMTTLRTE